MKTPICDFVNSYALSDFCRFHMPGHKGRDLLGFEHLDITEIRGADSLYEADGIIAQSEANASALFGSAATFYSAEGSSLCIRAMLSLLLSLKREGMSRTVFAARNVHKSFVYAAALLDFDIVWLLPREGKRHLCQCLIGPGDLEKALASAEVLPAAVFVTSPDYLGSCQDISALAEVCHRHGTYLAVDNAHGAYLHFLPQKCHPLDLGADICCDSAHKTLPVVTGGAYLHLAEPLPPEFAANARAALSLFGSTSPSYLILSSLDRCNALLEKEYPEKIAAFLPALEKTGNRLRTRGYTVPASDPLRITVRAGAGETGFSLADRLRREKIEPEFCDQEYLVLMLTPYNTEEELLRLEKALEAPAFPPESEDEVFLLPERVMSPRSAIFSRKEWVPTSEALGRVCADPSVSCPPAVPLVVPGERIGPNQVRFMTSCRMDRILCVAGR